MYGHNEAIQLIEEAFPSLREDLHDEVIEGLLHPQMGEFSRLAQSFIDRGQKDDWQAVTAVFMSLWVRGDPAVKNALNVSFLEHLNFADGKTRRHWAYEAMPAPMRTAWSEMDVYNRRLHGG